MKVRMEEASLRSAVHCEVRACPLSSVPLLFPAFINQDFSVSKSRSCQTLSKSSSATTQQKKGPVSQLLEGLWQLTQSKCCRLEGRISPCKVTCPISTDRITLIGGPAIILLSFHSHGQLRAAVYMLLILLVISAVDKTRLKDSFKANNNIKCHCLGKKEICFLVPN